MLQTVNFTGITVFGQVNFIAVVNRFWRVIVCVDALVALTICYHRIVFLRAIRVGVLDGWTASSNITDEW